MSIPSSFCTMSTKQCARELVGLLLSLSIHHSESTIYIISDSDTQKYITESSPQPKIKIVWHNVLDKYSLLNRQTMEQTGKWLEFQMEKANIMKLALETESDTMFLDSDIIVMDTLSVDNNKDIGVSPHFIQKQYTDKYGFYNGGMIWTKNKSVPDDWIAFSKTSRYYDQACIEDLAKKYSYFEFDITYNYQWSRFLMSELPRKTIIKSFSANPNDKIYYNNVSLKCIHTHFNDSSFSEFNNLIISLAKSAKLYKLLLVIYRIINDKWIIKIPKQPISGLFFHNNDSYRHLPLLYKLNNRDVSVELVNKTGHCWIEPNILTYDRPTLEWMNCELKNASIVLLGNGDVNDEGKIIKQQFNVDVKPWIFWPRMPMLVEKILNENLTLSFSDRKIKSIFIGNIENNVQAKYRQNQHNWSMCVEEYYCTTGNKHQFTHEEYLMKIRSSRFGLCLRGYGKKCHREVELMAFGTVPVVTDNVNVSSFIEPLVEDVHYLYATNPEEFLKKTEEITEEIWNKMSSECCKWYMRNIHSKYGWNNLINNLLF